MNTSAPGRYKGFSLIEVLIALVILSVGLLGIAAMVSVSLKSKDSAYSQTQATALAQAILDRMRANHSAATSGAYDVAIGTTPTAPACMGSANSCTAAQVATFDLADWKNSLKNALPQGDGSIATVAVAQFTQVTISIEWNDERAAKSLAAGNATSAAPASATTTFVLTSGI